MRTLPIVIGPRLEFDEASVTLQMDPVGQRFGAFFPFTGALRMHASSRQREDWRCWREIQKERKRLGLPELTTEEMEI